MPLLRLWQLSCSGTSFNFLRNNKSNYQLQIEWLEGTDPEYLNQILSYTEDAEHDDAPDSAACVCRILDRRGGGDYKSPFAR